MRTTKCSAILSAVITAGVLLASAGAAGAAPASGSGYNDWSCRPSAAHPYPVVALHGLGGTADDSFPVLGPYLADAGYCVFALTYGQPNPALPIGGLEPVATSAQQIAAFIDRVRGTTGAAKVELFGHSEGAFLALYVPKVLGYANRIDRVVALAPPTHGTSFDNAVTVADLVGLRPELDQVLQAGCAPCAEVEPGGSAVKALTAGPIAQPGLRYSVIESRTDEVVTPPSSAFIAEPGVSNAYVQDTCPLDLVGHIGLVFDTGVAAMVRNALDPAHPVAVPCALGLPV
ncbi:esterase/lipase family protein [Kutzneria sp. NPDC052558]|uniref:esterase/lipase family protein n=1 Tax=Kutzneria sp. NPDC052558 TaxID=3364121 RepID=UPI0037C50D75